MILWGMFVGIVTLMAWGGEGNTLSGFFIVVLISGCLAGLLRYVYKREHVPAFTTLLIFIAAYCPRSWAAIEQGFAFPLYASADAVGLALLSLVCFMGVAIGVARVLSGVLERPAKAVEFFATANRPNIGAVALGMSTVTAMIAGFRAGLWSNYGELGEMESGGIRLELLYYPLLFAFSASMGRSTLKEAIREKSNTTRAAAMGAVWLVCVTLLFIAQSRRLMLGALIVAVTSAWFESTKISWFRTGIVGAGLAFLGVALLVGSYLWRQEGLSTDAVERLQTISTRSVDLDAASKNFSERLTYLWIDSTSIENLSTLYGRFDLWDSFSTTVITATPGVIMPDKYLYPVIVCEAVYSQFGWTTDLPCTPTTEGLIFGGVFGVFITAVFFGAAISVVTALYRRGSFAGVTLASVALTDCLAIECSAFPLIRASRLLILTILLSAAIAWTLRFLSRLWTPDPSNKVRRSVMHGRPLRHIRHAAATNKETTDAPPADTGEEPRNLGPAALRSR